jgi:hypothetical protein
MQYNGNKYNQKWFFMKQQALRAYAQEIYEYLTENYFADNFNPAWGGDWDGDNMTLEELLYEYESSGHNIEGQFVPNNFLYITNIPDCLEKYNREELHNLLINLKKF